MRNKSSKNRRTKLPASAAISVVLALIVGSSIATASPAPKLTASPKGQLASGVLNYYDGEPATVTANIVAAFNQAYPNIHVNVLSLSSSQLVPRVETEQLAGEYNADVVQGTAIYMGQLIDGGFIQKFTPSTEEPLPPSVHLPKGYPELHGIETFIFAYNPTQLAEHGIKPPTTWADFAKPEWRGHFSMNPTDVDWVEGLIAAMGKKKALALITSLGNNDPVLVTSHTQGAAQVQSGATWGTVSLHGIDAPPLAAATPTEFAYVVPNPLPLAYDMVEIAKRAPDLANAKIFVNWMDSLAGQKAMVRYTLEASLHKGVLNHPTLWNPEKWKPAWAKVVSTATYNVLLHDLDTALHVPIT